MIADKELVGICTNCGDKINYSDIAEEIRQSSWEEIICQHCYDIEE